MEVFRIVLKKWSDVMTGSGYPGRWNSKGKFVVYTSSSRALASLENIVHRSGEGLNQNFRTMVIHVPDSLQVLNLDTSKLRANWHEFQHFRHCQAMGDQWLEECETAVLRVPSSIVKHEYNYLLNPQHSDFKKICIIDVEPFDFDPRIKK
ncbi:RES family NAD+ phosphorylase [Portibacter marinus]|uniref:RES family NAD+ phosphorylase n=1 Tax=Portibacter marinus TaxID=2898660 RepID=UPI001F1F8506|nr:RES family NAD+ phosphorylase [Portibacter marinus]